MKFGGLVLLCSFLLGGCAGHRFGFPSGTRGDESPNVGELVNFQVDFAAKSPADRVKECRALRKKQGAKPEARWLLRLMIGRALSEGCGEPAALLRAYDALAGQRSLEQPVAGMAAYQAEVLKRVGRPARQAVPTGRKSRDETVQPAGKDKAEPTPPAAKDEAKLLREKLDAIRSMEKKMDEITEEPSR